MKIALINELYGTKRQGGEQEALNNLAEKLRGLDFTVDVHSYSSPDNLLKIKFNPAEEFWLINFK